jgi:hypothetical protein
MACSIDKCRFLLDTPKLRGAIALLSGISYCFNNCKPPNARRGGSLHFEGISPTELAHKWS